MTCLGLLWLIMVYDGFLVAYDGVLRLSWLIGFIGFVSWNLFGFRDFRVGVSAQG